VPNKRFQTSEAARSASAPATASGSTTMCRCWPGTCLSGQPRCLRRLARAESMSSASPARWGPGWG